MKPRDTLAPGDMLTCRAAAELSGLNPGQIRRLGREGLLVTRRIPGTRTLYSRDSLLRLIEESIGPATASK